MNPLTRLDSGKLRKAQATHCIFCVFKTNEDQSQRWEFKDAGGVDGGCMTRTCPSSCGLPLASSSQVRCGHNVYSPWKLKHKIWWPLVLLGCRLHQAPSCPGSFQNRPAQEISTSIITTTKSCEVPRYLTFLDPLLMTSLLVIVGNTGRLYGRNSPPVCVTSRHGGVANTQTKHTTQLKLFNYWMLCRQLKPMRSQEIKWDSMAAAFNVQFTLSHF